MRGFWFDSKYEIAELPHLGHRSSSSSSNGGGGGGGGCSDFDATVLNTPVSVVYDADEAINGGVFCVQAEPGGHGGDAKEAEGRDSSSNRGEPRVAWDGPSDVYNNQNGHSSHYHDDRSSFRLHNFAAFSSWYWYEPFVHMHTIIRGIVDRRIAVRFSMSQGSRTGKLLLFVRPGPTFPDSHAAHE
jgi:hypothetical protein